MFDHLGQCLLLSERILPISLVELGGPKMELDGCVNIGVSMYLHIIIYIYVFIGAICFW